MHLRPWYTVTKQKTSLSARLTQSCGDLVFADVEILTASGNTAKGYCVGNYVPLLISTSSTKYTVYSRHPLFRTKWSTVSLVLIFSLKDKSVNIFLIINKANKKDKVLRVCLKPKIAHPSVS